MKRLLISLTLCFLLIFGVVPAGVFAQEVVHTFEYIKRGASTGDGYVVVEYDDVKVELNGDTATAEIPDGANVTVTIKAQLGSAITALAYDNAPMGFGEPAIEFNMTIENYSDNHSLKVTYMAATFNCSVSSIGAGKVDIVNPSTDAESVEVPMGDNFEFYAQAEDGCEILGITINGEEVDLSSYGQSENVKITRFNLEVPGICEDTHVVVTFSEKKTDNTLKFGDVNKDSQVNVKDATMIQKFVADMVEFDSAQIKCGDVDADNRVTVKDATAIQKYTAGIIVKFPVEK